MPPRKRESPTPPPRASPYVPTPLDAGDHLLPGSPTTLSLALRVPIKESFIPRPRRVSTSAGSQPQDSGTTQTSDAVQSTESTASTTSETTSNSTRQSTESTASTTSETTSNSTGQGTGLITAGTTQPYTLVSQPSRVPPTIDHERLWRSVVLSDSWKRMLSAKNTLDAGNYLLDKDDLGRLALVSSTFNPSAIKELYKRNPIHVNGEDTASVARFLYGLVPAATTLRPGLSKLEAIKLTTHIRLVSSSYEVASFLLSLDLSLIQHVYISPVYLHDLFQQSLAMCYPLDRLPVSHNEFSDLEFSMEFAEAHLIHHLLTCSGSVTLDYCGTFLQDDDVPLRPIGRMDLLAEHLHVQDRALGNYFGEGPAKMAGDNNDYVSSWIDEAFFVLYSRGPSGPIPVVSKHTTRPSSLLWSDDSLIAEHTLINMVHIRPYTWSVLDTQPLHPPSATTVAGCSNLEGLLTYPRHMRQTVTIVTPVFPSVFERVALAQIPSGSTSEFAESAMATARTAYHDMYVSHLKEHYLATGQQAEERTWIGEEMDRWTFMTAEEYNGSHAAVWDGWLGDPHHSQMVAHTGSSDWWTEED